MNNIKPSKIVLIFIIFIIIVSFIGIIFYINLSKDYDKDITATVKYIGNNYMILTDKKNNEYKIEIIKDVEIDDIVKITIHNIDDTKIPITANLKKINDIKKKEVIDNKDTTNNSNLNDNSNNHNHLETNSNTQSNNNNSNKIYTEEDIITYVNNLNNELQTTSSDKSTSEAIKEKFVKIVDFLFYDGTIYNKKFSELSNSAKLKILSLTFKIDSLIDSKFPNYKQNLNEKYKSVKNKALELYLDKTVELCQKNDSLCANAKNELNELKTNFSLTWSNVKDIASNNLNKLKEWYEIWRTQ